MDTALYIETIKKECVFLEKEGYPRWRERLARVFKVLK